MIHKFQNGERPEHIRLWECYTSEQMSKNELEARMREDDEFRLFVEARRLEGKLNAFIDPWGAVG